MPGEGPVSTSCRAGLANDVDAGPSPGMTASYSRATVEEVIPLKHKAVADAGHREELPDE
jgi:hypothetical protein